MYKILVLFIIIFSFSGCRYSKEDNDELYRKINENLFNSTSIVEVSNRLIYVKLDEDAKDWQTKNIATKYQARALVVKEKADIVCRYIDSVNTLFKRRADFEVSKEESDQLLKPMSKYIYEILNFNDDVHQIFKDDTIVDFLRKTSKESNFYESYFANAKGEKCKMAINSLYNNARLAENRIISYCVSNYCKIKIVYDH